MDLQDKVQALLDSDRSAYQIAKDTGVAQPNITNLRNGERSVENISLKTAEALARYWDAAMIDLAIHGQENNPKLGEFRNVLQTTFDELLDDQRDIAHSNEANENDLPMYYVLRALFADANNDNVEFGRLMSEYAKHI